MKIQKGMYVRYTRGAINGYVPPRIAKIVDKNNDLLKLDNNNEILESDIIGKPSFDLIDLIEVGDYVNGMCVIAKDSDNRLYVAEDLGEPYYREFYNGCFDYTLLETDNFKIKDIVTKEQFNACKYVVERDK